MVKDKKVNDKNKERDLSNKDRFEILLEDMRHEFKVVGDGHGILLNEIRENNRKSEERDNNLDGMIKFSVKVLHEKIDKVEGNLNKKIDNVEIRLTEKIDGVDKRLVNVEQDVGVLKQDVGVLKQDVGVLKQDVKKIDNRLVNVEQKVDKIDAKLDKVIERQDKQEVRQDKQEIKIDEVYHKVFSEGAGF